ncbi:MAG: 4Fe-4S dicluster domain-containing protein, partial [Bacillota bacterium]
ENARADSAFRFLKDTRSLAAGYGRAAFLKPDCSPPAEKECMAQTNRTLKEIAFDYGADLFGAAVLGLECFYRVRGRGDSYGKPVKNPLRNTLVYAVEMNRKQIEKAPRVEELIEASRSYVRVMLIGMALSYFLRELGFQARAHIEGESELILPAAAAGAGIGEIGRMGLLITGQHGPMIRLGAVTTSYPVDDFSDNSSPVSEKGLVKKFCQQCGLCAENCPGKAIPSINELNKSTDTGKPRWNIDLEACYSIWHEYGTSCGICVAVCPYNSNINISNYKQDKR